MIMKRFFFGVSNFKGKKNGSKCRFKKFEWSVESENCSAEKEGVRVSKRSLHFSLYQPTRKTA